MKKKIKILTLIVAILSLTLSLGIAQKVFADDNPIFVTITSDCCSTCQKLKPVVEDLEYEYGSQITFLTFNVSSRASLEEAKQIAEEHGISEFFNNNKNAVPKVGILCPGGKAEKTFLGEIRKEVYEKAIDELLNDTTQLCSL